MEVNTDKKKVIIIIAALLSISLIMMMLVFFFMGTDNKEEEIKSETKEQKITATPTPVKIDRSDWSVSNQTELAHKAVEEFTKDSDTETKSARKIRLQKYFTNDSPVYDYESNNISFPVTKSSGTVSYVNSCEEQEGNYLCLLVTVNTSLSSAAGNNLINQTYWLTIRKIGNKFMAYDLGIYDPSWSEQ